ncbi:glycoside hydrolase family 3 protein [Panacibacter ginsenosidivorans]|uniref:beta-glucosidase n=1 Tax=Panacibacter ginsenosidivorans TaxID=1813871 RepID=A0A5B8V5W0_9BACT|nr:glycoside hydrolase family 3 N-terminal domain-containing protein [Panacibacter ginsenosidivorans]QEC66867.1 glycoside hydrolase family 3 protein [Panacibacter ginsenosidivorans]
MRKIKLSITLCLVLQAALLHAQNWSEKINGTLSTVTNKNGQTLGYSTSSGVKLIIVDGFAFKDLNKNGKLDKYEDWRLSADVRAKDLASQMSVEQIAGLMLYSRHQPIPTAPTGPFAGTYNGKSFAESGANASDLSDQQKTFLTKDNVRHVLVTSVKSPEVAAEWNNNVQALTESIGLGIPANNSSDPRHGTIANAEFNAGAGGAISMWPGSLGLAATFDPAVVKQFGHIAAQEYRALGIATALSPQIDMASEPRWNRFSGTFGEDPKLAADMARAYIDGFQTSTGDKEIKDGWGYNSVNAMVKHWPGGGSGEGGRDAHYGFGKYAVYPGNNFAQHQVPFTEGAFKLEGKTGMAAAVMPYYTISWNQDTKNHENVANNYNSYIITDLLRKKYHYDGVVCTDWLVTGDETAVDIFITGKSWGVDSLTLAQRHYKILMAGVDQFGGNNDAAPVIEAYNIGVREHGEKFMRARFEESAVRLLKNIFRTGLFENPYVDPEISKSLVGNPEFMKAGYDAQLKSMVLLKNKNNVLPLQKNKTVYVPKQFTPAGRNFLGMETPEKLDYPVSLNIIKKYFNVTDNPDEADYALVFINSPNSGLGYKADDVKAGGNGYLPISLQYGPYTATDARATSIAGGDKFEKFTNRSYKGKTVTAINTTDLAMVTETFTKMKGKPVIVSVNVSNPMVFSEFEKDANAILVNFGVQAQAILDILTGNAEPSGLLPFQMPANMQVVEKQNEDVPHDMQCYKDSQGNVYDFGYGLNWKGVIKDARTTKYKVK